MNTIWRFTSFRPLIAYQPLSVQPKLGRTRAELSDCERPIYDAFNNSSFVNQFIKYISLEEHKGKESFHPKYFTFFKVQNSSVVIIDENDGDCSDGRYDDDD